MLWRRDVTEIALARSEHFISNTQAESLPNFQTNSKCTIRLEILGGFVICFVVLAETGLWEQPIGPRKWSQWSHSAAVCKFWKLGSLSFLKLRLYSWARAMWLWVCPALAKMGSPWLSPAHILFSHRLRLSSPAVPPAWAPGAFCSSSYYWAIYS